MDVRVLGFQECMQNFRVFGVMDVLLQECNVHTCSKNQYLKK
jgi:hypothetical protein